jgi:hypothetical protein
MSGGKLRADLVSRRGAAVVRRVRGATAEQWCTFLVVAACVVFVGSRLHPGLIIANTTPTGGDTGAHVYAPAFLRDHLLPHGRLSGWAPGWYDGFPLYTFYPVVPALGIVGLGVVLPYGIAMKLVTTAGLLFLPIAAYAAGRLARLSFPTPAVLAAATIPFLFDQSFSIWGGNVESTLAGEFSFSIALSLAVLSFGLWCRALQTGRGKSWAAGILGLTCVCHPIVAFYAAVGTATIVAVHLVTRQAPLRRLRDAIAMAAVAVLLASFWVVPFVMRRTDMSSMGFGPLPDPGKNAFDYLAPPHLRWVLGVAAVGVIASLWRRNRLGIALALDAGIFAAIFPHFPDLGLWNARLLPFYFLCVYLLAGLGAVALVQLGAWALGRLDAEVRRWALVGSPVAVLGFVVVLVGLPLHALPGGTVNGNNYTWLGLSTSETSVVPSWSKQNYGGYEREAAWPEYHAVMSAMTQVGRDNGCGRADYEYDASLGRYGTPDAMMLLPYWTDGCIDSIEGLYYESSATTPYHFLTLAEISEHPSNPVAGLPYGGFNLKAGISHMRLLGVRYYMAFSAVAVKAADKSPSLVRLATSGPWHIYEITGASVVEPLTTQPVVVSGTGGSWKNWRNVAVPWFTKVGTPRAEPELTASGPATWQHISGDTKPTATRVTPPTVSDVHVDDDDISFHVSRPGTPVLVKTSYFPNWSASGADGPYRATPNLMVVVPTSTSVHLHYGWTWVDIASYALSVLGLAGLFLLRRLAPKRPAQAGEAEQSAGDAAHH